MRRQKEYPLELLLKLPWWVISAALGVIFFAACAFAQPPAPAWLSRLKLSGLSGPADHRLAIINGKNFSPGENRDLKLARTTVNVTCLEIREQSVLVQIRDLPGPYELTMSGAVISLAVDNNPVAAVPSQPVASIEPPPPATATIPVVPLVRPLVPSEATQLSPPSSSGTAIPLTTILFLAGIILALVIGIAMGTGVAQQLHRKNIGEAMLAETISQNFNRPHLLLNNITLPTAEGTTQIDHVLVADTGIFVIETKHYTGWIFGHPQDKQWTQTIYRRKSRFQNPLRQNHGHVKTLQALFALPEDHFHSVVVFTGEARFKTDLGPSVVHLANLIPFLSAERPVVFDERKMAYAIGRIEMKRKRRSLETDEYHINHLRNRFAGKNSNPSPQAMSTPAATNPFATAAGDAKYQPKA